MPGFGEDFLASRIMLLVPLWLSLSVHEWAHAMSAFQLGDDTAARQGRLTLNPLEHIDPIGTLVLPLLGIPFGWAKPVPIVPARFGSGVSMRTGLVLTAAAGPLSNIILAVFAATGLGLLSRFGIQGGGLETLLETTVFLNLILAVFNLLPIPPLDGSRIVDGWIPDGWRPGWNAFGRMAPIALAAVIVLPLLAGVSLLGAPIDGLSRFTEALRTVVAGS